MDVATNISFNLGFYVETGSDFEISSLTYFIGNSHLMAYMAYNMVLCMVYLSVTMSSCGVCLELNEW